MTMPARRDRIAEQLFQCTFKANQANNVSIRDAAKLSRLPKSTFESRMKKILGGPKIRIHNRRALKDHKEIIVRDALLRMADLGKPMDLMDIAGTVHELVLTFLTHRQNQLTFKELYPAPMYLQAF